MPFGVGLVQLGDVVKVEARLTENDPEKLDFGMDVELQIVPFYIDADGDEIVTFAFAPVADGDRATEELTMDDVAIIGVGLHPFGRFGDKTAFEMGADAVELALRTPGVAWNDVAAARSAAAGRSRRPTRSPACSA